MKNYRKIVLLMVLLYGGIFITSFSYAWIAGGGVKWIGRISTDSRFINYSSDLTYGTGYYLDSFTDLKWQAENGPYGLKWVNGTTNSGDDNYCGKFSEPIWDNNNSIYLYNPPDGYTADEYEAFKYCEGIGDNHWRLPTQKELFSIISDTETEKNASNFYSKLPSILHSYYWSSTNNYNTSYAWYGIFSHGYISSYYKNNTSRYTICVHD